MKKFSCIMYHEISDTSTNKFTVSKKTFEKHIELIVKNKIPIIPLNAIPTMDNQFGVITFDDGYKSNIYAAEKLAQQNIKGTFFLVEEFIKINNNKYLDKNDVKYIASLGHEIGVHGKTHDWWTKKTPTILIEDLKEAKHFLQDITGLKIRSCSAPGGMINASVINNITESNNFDYIRTSIPSINFNKKENENIIYATGIRGNGTDSQFLKKLQCNDIYYDWLYCFYNVKKMAKPFYLRFK